MQGMQLRPRDVPYGTTGSPILAHKRRVDASFILSFTFLLSPFTTLIFFTPSSPQHSSRCSHATSSPLLSPCLRPRSCPRRAPAMVLPSCLCFTPAPLILTARSRNILRRRPGRVRDHKLGQRHDRRSVYGHVRRLPWRGCQPEHEPDLQPGHPNYLYVSQTARCGADAHAVQTTGSPSSRRSRTAASAARARAST
jgi:hypothetical protein